VRSRTQVKSIYLSVCLSVRPSVRPSVHLSLSLSLSLYICLSFCLSVYLSVYLSVCLSAGLSTLNRKPWLKVWHSCFTFTNCLSFIYVLVIVLFKGCTGRHSAVGIATRYRPDSPGFIHQLGRDFSHLFRLALWTTQPSGQCRR